MISERLTRSPWETVGLDRMRIGVSCKETDRENPIGIGCYHSRFTPDPCSPGEQSTIDVHSILLPVAHRCHGRRVAIVPRCSSGQSGTVVCQPSGPPLPMDGARRITSVRMTVRRCLLPRG